MPATASPASYTPKHLADKILSHRAALAGERKSVTVLFVDIQGSLALSDAVDPELWHRILDRFFGLLSETIHRYEGTINQYTGDGVMALFGAPIAHEDHAVRACRAALELVDITRDYATELRLSEGLNVAMRFGLNSGEVVVGRIGDDLRMDYTAQGATVGLAARMEAIAEPGRAYLTRNTARLVDDYFDLRDLGETQVKGISEPVRVYELLGSGAAILRLERSQARGLSGFVGREPELAQLDAALLAVRDAVDGEAGRTVAVVGDAGLGKSRLCHEFAARCAERGMAVHTCSGVPYGDAVPLLPVQTMMRSLAGLSTTDSAAVQQRKLAGALAMAEVYGESVDSTEDRALAFDFLGLSNNECRIELAEELRQRRLIQIFARLLAAATVEPSLMLVEDLHWLDDGSNQFLFEGLKGLRRTRALLIVNSRPGDIDDCVQRTLTAEIELRPLGQTEIKVMLDEWLGADSSVADLAAHISEQAAGNPFFVEEAVRSLHEDGLLTGSRGDYRCTDKIEALEIPATVQAILAARIDRLEDADKDLLQMAAVIGQQFSQSQLAALANIDFDDLTAALQRLRTGSYIAPENADDECNDCWVFIHPLTQEVAYRSQLTEARANRHRRMGEWLEAQLPNQDDAELLDVYEDSLQLARHWQRAGDAIKAAHWTYQSARFAVQRDITDSLQRYRKAVELADVGDDPALVSIAIKARAAIIRTAAFNVLPRDEVETAYEHARRLVDQTGDRYSLAELLISYGALEQQSGDADQAAGLTVEALAIARELGNHQLEARFRVAILLSYFAAGRLNEGLEALRGEGVTPWEDGPISGENLASRGFRALYLCYMGDIKSAESEIEQALDLTRDTGRNISWLYGNQIDIAWFSGKPEGMISAGQTAMQQAEEYGSPMFRALAWRALATAYLMNDQPQAALPLLQDSLPETEPGAIAHQFYGVHLSLLALTLNALGRYDEALEKVRLAVTAATKSHTRIWELRSRLALAEILLSRDEVLAADRDVASAELDRCDRLIEQTGAVVVKPRVISQRQRLQSLSEAA